MNMKVIMLAVGAFVLGLGGSTAAVFMTAPVKPAPSAAAATHGGAVQGAGAPAGAAATDSTHGAHAGPQPASPEPAEQSTIAQHGANSTEVNAAAHLAKLSNTASHASTESPAGYRQVARVLSSMKPADAAKIAAYLTDDQVEGILGQLGVRQAASLLTELPTERAAALSKRIMKHTEAK